jgi:predicted metal-dependent RNase
LAWMTPLAGTVKKIFLIHGEIEGAGALQTAIQAQYGIETLIPDWGETFELL